MSRPKLRIKLFLLFAVAAFALLLFVVTPRISNKVFETFETQNGHFRIRVRAHAEVGGGFVPGAYYVFESAPVSTGNWRKIMVYRHDDPMPIPRERVRFVSDRIAYIFIGFMYAVTLDSGRTWSVWRADKSVSQFNGCKYLLPAEITIATDGTGSMTLLPLNQECASTRKLYTTDYGKHWSAN